MNLDERNADVQQAYEKSVAQWLVAEKSVEKVGWMSSATSAMVALDHSRQQVSSLTDAVEHEQRLRWANQDIASWLLAESREILRRYISRMVDAEDALRDIRSVVAPYLNRSDDDERKALALGQ